jgi:hypothetical protein
MLTAASISASFSFSFSSLRLSCFRTSTILSAEIRFFSSSVLSKPFFSFDAGFALCL